MGSGPRKTNIKLPRSPLADGGPIHCAEMGRASATLLSASPIAQTGHLRIQDEQLLLIVNGEVVAIAHDEALKHCVMSGFEYLATLEAEHAPPTIRYRLV